MCAIMSILFGEWENIVLAKSQPSLTFQYESLKLINKSSLLLRTLLLFSLWNHTKTPWLYLVCFCDMKSNSPSKHRSLTK